MSDPEDIEWEDVKIMLHCPHKKDLMVHAIELSKAIDFTLEQLEGAESLTDFQDIVPEVAKRLRDIWDNQYITQEELEGK